MMENLKSLLVKFFDTLGNKASHYLYTYLFAIMVLIVQALFSGFPSGEDISFISLLLAPIFFPAGLGAMLTKLWEIFSRNSADITEVLITGWLAYIVTFLIASYTKNIRTRKILYFIFILLIVLNFYGCANTYWGI